MTTQQSTFDPYTDDLFADWTPTAQDYADLDAMIDAERQSIIDAEWGDWLEMTFDPDL
jgi:hypothetical protein